MKLRFIFVALLGLLSLNINAQDDFIKTFFEKHSENENFTSIYVAPKLFSLFKDMDLNLDDAEAEKVMTLAEDFNSLRILVAEDADENLHEEFNAKFSKANYEVLIRINDKGTSNIDFLIKETENMITDLLMLVSGTDSDFVMINFTGNISLDKLNQLMDDVDFQENTPAAKDK